MNYDQWKTASPFDDDAPEQTINDLLCDGTIIIGYGKPGHGMNGKNADLDRIGQFVVKSLETVDPIGGKSMMILIHCRLYCSICGPSIDNIDYYRERISPQILEHLYDCGEDPNNDDVLHSYLMDQAESVVCGMHPDTFGTDPFACMWDGDYWVGGINVTLEVPLSIDEYEIIECACDPTHDSIGFNTTLSTIAKRICDEIYGSNQGGTTERDKVKLFEDEVGLANDLIEKLTD